MSAMNTMTEAEALTKWCPKSQLAITANGGVVANTLSGSATTCAGTGCMAWRWAVQPAGLGARRESVGYGYCGLAGATP